MSKNFAEDIGDILKTMDSIINFKPKLVKTRGIVNNRSRKKRKRLYEEYYINKINDL